MILSKYYAFRLMLMFIFFNGTAMAGKLWIENLLTLTLVQYEAILCLAVADHSVEGY